MVDIDFNLALNFGQYIFTDSLKEFANALWMNGFLTTDRLFAEEQIFITLFLLDLNFMSAEAGWYFYC
jgi:hypothetical protein